MKSKEEILKLAEAEFLNICDEGLFPNHSDKDIWINGFNAGYAASHPSAVQEEALRKITNWELPATGEFWDEEKTKPISYEAQYGSNGVRSYIRSIAKASLSSPQINDL